MSVRSDGRTTVLYLAPWADLGGSDRNTVDLLRWIDRDRYRMIFATTQESRNRRLHEIACYADEVWPLPELVPGGRMPSLLLDLIATRGVDVVHVMNSRLGFQLLPDISALEEPPGVLVQLHVEEADRSGYVRYVTTRYGNLVDAWSVSSRNLARIVEDYGVLPARIETIYTGIDAEREFSPAHATPVELEPGAFHVLYLGRWVEQKDPLVMLDVAERLVARHPEVRIHAVGEGDLEGAMRERIARAGLERHVLLHPTTSDVQSWFAASDAMLMTSVYEGLPLVLFEAMAMGVPSVTPALPANAELMGDAGGVLVDPRDDVGGYVEALSAWVRDPARAQAVGAGARARVREGFTLRAMADGHGALYDRIAARRAARLARAAARDEPAREPAVRPVEPLREVRFGERVPGAQPLVSIVIPCYEHGRWLGETLDSIWAQRYPELQVIVVDDASRDPATLDLLRRLDADERVEVVRMPQNGGPSKARNAGLARVRGRYVLPVDADNVLLPDAVANLVDQLSHANETVGFVYPNQQFFGNRRDYAPAPAWNPYRLLDHNYCDTCSLYDARVFAAGLRYPEDIVLGHEDWDVALTLAENGVRGEPARVPTLLVRKHGFTRSDLVDATQTDFAELMAERHPDLFGWTGRYGAFTGPAARLKARWAPFASIVALSAVELESEEGRRLVDRAATQTCADAELLLPWRGRWEDRGVGPWLRRIPPGSSDLAEGRLGIGLAMARGQVVLATRGTGSSLLADPAFVEKLAVLFADGAVDAVALTDSGDAEAVLLGRVAAPAQGGVHALAWRNDGRWLPDVVAVLGAEELGSLARALIAGGARLEWRNAPAPRSEQAPAPVQRWPRRPVANGSSDPPALPALGEIPRGTPAEGWRPALTTLIARHRRIGSEERHLSVNVAPPAGWELDHLLGAAQLHTPPGTTRLFATAGGSFLTDVLPEAAALITDDDRYLGSLEQIGFLGLDALFLGVMYATGQHVLVAGRDDPLFGACEIRAELGFVEPVPLRPRGSAFPPSTWGLVELHRSLDVAARRNRYAVGRIPPGEAVGTLGLLHYEPQHGSVPLWITPDDHVVGAEGAPRGAAPHPRQLARWAGAPAGWRGFGHPQARARSVARRASDALAAYREPPPPPAPADGPPAGYGHAGGGPGRVPLWAARHPVTGDQLVTWFPLEAQDMGYVDATLLAWLNEPREGGPRRVTVPWASRYGLEARWA